MNKQHGTKQPVRLVIMAVSVLAAGALLLVACQGGGGTAIELRDFEYRPNQMTAKAGEPATLSLKNTGTQLHDYVIDELNATSPVVNPGQMVSFAFTPSRAGTFRFYCNQPGHKAAGMVGTITIS